MQIFIPELHYVIMTVYIRIKQVWHCFMDVFLIHMVTGISLRNSCFSLVLFRASCTYSGGLSGTKAD